MSCVCEACVSTLFRTDQGGAWFGKLPAELSTTHAHVQVDLVKEDGKQNGTVSQANILHDSENKRPLRDYSSF